MMSAPFELIQAAVDADDRNGITLRLPVYSPGRSPPTIMARRQRFVGSLAASFRVRPMIADAMPDGVGENLHLTVSDVSSGSVRLLYDSAARFA